MLDKKGQISGVVTALIFGIATLVIGIIIAFVVVSTILNGNLLTSNRVTGTVTNETTGGINNSGYTLVARSSYPSKAANSSYVITQILNDVGGVPKIVPVANYTISSVGVVKNATVTTYTTNATISYTYQNLTIEELSSNKLSNNFTNGVQNVSTKVPTVLLIAAIILILGVLAILVGVWQRMRMGGGGAEL